MPTTRRGFFRRAAGLSAGAVALLASKSEDEIHDFCESPVGTQTVLKGGEGPTGGAIRVFGNAKLNGVIVRGEMIVPHDVTVTIVRNA